MKGQIMDIALPQYASDYDGYMLMKFTSSIEYQNDFLDGRLFFNTSDYFSTCESKGRGDRNEGNTFVVNYNNPGLQAVTTEVIDGEVCLVFNDYSDRPQDYRPGTVWNFSKAENRNRKLICFFTMFVNISNRIVSGFPSNMGEEFGEYGVLILNRQEFFKRIDEAFQINSCYRDAKMGFVDYQEMRPGINQWNPFRKDKELFAYQNEFRITFISDDDKAIKLDIGKTLRDIAVPILASDVEKIKFTDDKIVYPLYSNSSCK